MAETMRAMYAAATIDDEARLKEIFADDFYAFDLGKRFDGMELAQVIKAAHGPNLRADGQRSGDAYARRPRLDHLRQSRIGRRRRRCHAGDMARIRGASSRRPSLAHPFFSFDAGARGPGLTTPHGIIRISPVQYNEQSLVVAERKRSGFHQRVLERFRNRRNHSLPQPMRGRASATVGRSR